MIQPKNIRLFRQEPDPIRPLEIDDASAEDRKGSYDRFTDAIQAGDHEAHRFRAILEDHGFKVRLGGSPRRRRVQPLVLERLQEDIGRLWEDPLRGALGIILEVEKRNGAVPVTMEYVAGLALMVHRYGSHPAYSAKRLARRVGNHTVRWYTLQAREQSPQIRREYGVFGAMLDQYNIAGDEWEAMPDLRRIPLPRWDEGRELMPGGMLGRMGDGEGGSISIDLGDLPIPEFVNFTPYHDRDRGTDVGQVIDSGADIFDRSGPYPWMDDEDTAIPNEAPIPHEDRDYLQALLQRITTYAMELEDELTTRGVGDAWILQKQADNGIRSTTRTFYEIPEEES